MHGGRGDVYTRMCLTTRHMTILALYRHYVTEHNKTIGKNQKESKNEWICVSLLRMCLRNTNKVMFSVTLRACCNCWGAKVTYVLTQSHRITECFGLEGTFKGHVAQTPCNEHGHRPLEQVAQSPVQPGLQCFQELGIYHLPEQPVPVSHHLHCKKFLPYS